MKKKTLDTIGNLVKISFTVATIEFTFAIWFSALPTYEKFMFYGILCSVITIIFALTYVGWEGVIEDDIRKSIKKELQKKARKK